MTNKLKEKNSIKIISTLGPSSFNKRTVQRMDKSGVDIFRINLSHTDLDELENKVLSLKKWTSKKICLDTEGAQLRTGMFAGDVLRLQTHSYIEFSESNFSFKNKIIPLSIANMNNVLKPGDLLKIDFHSVIVQIVEIKKKRIIARVIKGGVIGPNKGISVDRELHLPGFTEKDLKSFEIAKKLDILNLAISFTESKKHVIDLRNSFNNEITVISKIESIVGMKNLKEICLESDSILIDRGDLSRQIPIERIAFAQKYIQSKAIKYNTPVYVATNLLESMVSNYRPTRAEVNDISDTLVSGVSGLVLAAETAIGKYPVESVNMVASIINEMSINNKKLDFKHLSSPISNKIIKPHGGQLIQQYANELNQDDLRDIPIIKVDSEIFSDIINICEGTFSPINGFMNFAEINNVLYDLKSANGVTWTLPILFQINKEQAKIIPDNGYVGIKWEINGECAAILKIDKKEKIIHHEKIIKKWFGTDNIKHPGVAKFYSKGNYLLSGKVFLINKESFCKSNYYLTPKQIREICSELGWFRVIGFHTRNVIHRGHEYIQKKALKDTHADAILISPVVGKKKYGDFTEDVIISSYNSMIKNGYYNPFKVLLNPFNTYSRFSGPSEAVFTAICRKNYGCNYFIIGRDHTGIGKTYQPFEAQKIFETLDLEMDILNFDAVFYCEKRKKVTSDFKNPLYDNSRQELSGSIIRDLLRSGKNIPEYLMRKKIADELLSIYKRKKENIFETH